MWRPRVIITKDLARELIVVVEQIVNLHRITFPCSPGSGDVRQHLTAPQVLVNALIISLQFSLVLGPQSVRWKTLGRRVEPA